MSLAYVIVDEFTDTPLQGNQLTVFEDGSALSDDHRIKIDATRASEYSAIGAYREGSDAAKTRTALITNLCMAMRRRA